MISHNDSSTDGQSSHHNAGHRGPVGTVRLGSGSLPLYPSAIVCLGLLNALLMSAAVVIGLYCSSVIDTSSPDIKAAQTLIIEVKQLQIMQTKAIAAREEDQQALDKEIRSHRRQKLQLEQNKTVSDGLQGQLEMLQLEKATLQADTSIIHKSCGRCSSGWFLANATCYFHSKSESSPLKNWHDSRADCIRRGANLTVIDNWEEQLNLFEYLPKLEPSIRPWWSRGGGIWIGLSDIQTEGRWVWINNETLKERYWIQREPNNHGLEGEDCAALMNIKNPRETWFDSNCQETKEWLCEMEAI